MHKPKLQSLQYALMLLPLFYLANTNSVSAANNSVASPSSDASLRSSEFRKEKSPDSPEQGSTTPTTTDELSDAEKLPSTDTAVEIDTSISFEDLLQSGNNAYKSGDLNKAEQFYKAADAKLTGFARDGKKAFEVIEKLATLYNKQDRLKETIRELDRAMLIAQRLPESDSDTKVKTQFRLAKTCFKAGLPKRALVESLSAQSMCESTGVTDPLLKSQILATQGMVQTTNGLLADGKTSLDQALLLVAPLCPALTPATATTPAAPLPVLTNEQKKALVCKAEILAYQAALQRFTHSVKDADSDKLTEESLRLFKLANAPKNNLTYFEIDMSSRLAKEQTLTEEKLCKLLDKTIKEYGENSLASTIVIEQLAGYLFTQNKFDKSIAQINRSLKILDKLLPADNTRVSKLWGSAGFCHSRTGDTARSASEFKKAYDIDCNAAGEQSADLASSAEKLALAYASTGQMKEAENLTLQSWKINERLYGRKNSQVLQNLSNLGAIYSAQGRFKEAIQYTYWGYVATRQMYGPNSINLSLTSGNLGLLYLRSGNLKEAQNLFKQELALEAQRGMQRPEYADACSRMGRLLICQGKVSESVDWFGKCFKIKEKALGLTSRETYQAMSPYYDLLRRMGRTAEANSLQSRYKLALGKARKKAS